MSPFPILRAGEGESLQCVLHKLAGFVTNCALSFQLFQGQPGTSADAAPV